METSIIGLIFWPPGVPNPVKIDIGADRGVQHHHEAGGIDDSFDREHQTAGHIIILAFTSLISFSVDGGQAIGAGSGMGIFSTAFMIFMYFLELLVAFLQAFVFTLLAAIYFGDATHDPAHH